jgi:hypothetical protein
MVLNGKPNLCQELNPGKGKTEVIGGMPVLLPVSRMEWSQFVCVDDNREDKKETVKERACIKLYYYPPQG